MRVLSVIVQIKPAEYLSDFVLFVKRKDMHKKHHINFIDEDMSVTSSFGCVVICMSTFITCSWVLFGCQYTQLLVLLWCQSHQRQVQWYLS